MSQLTVNLPDFILDGFRDRCKKLNMTEDELAKVIIQYSLFNQDNFFELHTLLTN